MSRSIRVASSRRTVTPLCARDAAGSGATRVSRARLAPAAGVPHRLLADPQRGELGVDERRLGREEARSAILGRAASMKRRAISPIRSVARSARRPRPMPRRYRRTRPPRRHHQTSSDSRAREPGTRPSRGPAGARASNALRAGLERRERERAHAVAAGARAKHEIPGAPDQDTVTDRRGFRSCTQLRRIAAVTTVHVCEPARGAREQIALDQLDPGVDTAVRSVAGLDPLGDDEAAELATQRGHRGDDRRLVGWRSMLAYRATCRA